jgi:predicted GNAT superfamily acetyltransferase
MRRFEVRQLERLEELRQCERIQRRVWGTLAASSEVLAVTAKCGGAVLGVLTHGQVVGFIYAFLARRHGRLAHWSHMMAVEARYRDRGLGFRMKLAHRRLALEQGIKRICWTYDPLQSRNAFLNIARLGGLVSEYLPDCYGHFPSRIEKGLPSDRFVVDWRIASRRVARRLGATTYPPGDLRTPHVNETRMNAHGFLENRAVALGLCAPKLLVEVPANTDAMRARALPLARRWRLETRKVFEYYLSAGYRVEDFIPPHAASEGRCFYLLRRAPSGSTPR